MSIKPKTVTCIAVPANNHGAMKINDTFLYYGTQKFTHPSKPLIQVIHVLEHRSTSTRRFFDEPTFSKCFKFISKEKSINRCVSIW